MRISLSHCLVISSVIAASAWAQPHIGSCTVFPKDNPWNLDVSKLPVHPMSTTWINTYGSTRSLHPDWGSPRIYGIPFERVGKDQPLVPIEFDPGNSYPAESDSGPWPIPLNARVEGDSTDPNYEDHHVLVIDTDHCMLYELYHAVKNTSGTGWTVWSSAKFDLNKDDYRPDGWTSCDAAGLPIFPGLVRYDEVQSGAIHHALRFTVQSSQGGWIHPARHKAGSSDASHMPMGARLRLKATADLSSLSGGALVIAHAMQKYGIILADNGSNWFITGATDSRWDDNNIGLLKNLHGSDLEAVYTGPIKTTEESGAGVMFYGDSVSFTVSAGDGTPHHDSVTVVNTGNQDMRVTNVVMEDSSLSGYVQTYIPAGVGVSLFVTVTAPKHSFDSRVILVTTAPGHQLDTIPVHVHVTPSGVIDGAPTDFRVAAYPNPVMRDAEIGYTLPEGGAVSMRLVNTLGVEVQSLTTQTLSAGPHTLRITADHLPAGIYYATLRCGNLSATKMVVVQK